MQASLLHRSRRLGDVKESALLCRPLRTNRLMMALSTVPISERETIGFGHFDVPPTGVDLKNAVDHSIDPRHPRISEVTSWFLSTDLFFETVTTTWPAMTR